MSLLSRLPRNDDSYGETPPAEPALHYILARLAADDRVIRSLDLDDTETLSAFLAAWLDSLIRQEGWAHEPADRDRLLNDMRTHLGTYRLFAPFLADADCIDLTCFAHDRIVANHADPVTLPFRDSDHLLADVDAVCRAAGYSPDALHTGQGEPLSIDIGNGWVLTATLPTTVSHQFTVRFHRQPDPARFEQKLLHEGGVTPTALEFIRACVAARINVVVTANDRSLMHRLFNLVAGYVPPADHVAAVACPGDLNLTHPHTAFHDAGISPADRRRAVQACLRLDPQRLLVADLSGAETIDVLNAMKNGHDGSMASLYARHAKDALQRLALNCALSGETADRLAYRQLIDQSVQVIVHANRLSDGSERIMQITEVQGMSGEVNLLVDLFAFTITGMVNDRYEGQLAPTGIRPSVSRRFEDHGIHLPASIFNPHDPAPLDRRR